MFDCLFPRRGGTTIAALILAGYLRVLAAVALMFVAAL